MKRVLFIFDRVAHYHVDLFRNLEQRLREQGLELHLASGEVAQGAVGRVGVDRAVLATERKYRYTERSLRGWTLRRVHGLGRLLAEVQPQVVVCMGHVGNVSHWWLALNRRRLGIRLVAWQCGYEYHPGALKRLVLGRFVPRFDHHLAYHGNAGAYAREHGAAAAQVTVMHNTINEARIVVLPREQARAQVQARHPEIGTRQILLFVGAVLEEKRIELILEAMDQLSRADLVLVVVGDGPHLGRLREHAQGRADVVFAGAVIDGVGAYFDAAAMYLLPGTGGLGLNEAMAHGLPMIAGYADGSADDLVLDGETGFRLRTGTAAELAGHIGALLDDPVAAQRLGSRGRELINGPLAFTRFVDCVARVLVGEARHVA